MPSLAVFAFLPYIKALYRPVVSHHTGIYQAFVTVFLIVMQDLVTLLCFHIRWILNGY